jgi:hypothetical protein
MTVWSIIKAEYLTNENATKNWAFILMLLVMGVVVINLSHSADAKVKQIAKLKSEVKALRSEYVELKMNVMKKKMATDVYVRLKDEGFVFPKVPAVKIVPKQK